MNAINKPDARLEALRDAETEAMAAMRAGASLGSALDGLLRAVEAQSEVEMLASVLLVSEDGKRLLAGSAPSLPAAYNQALDGVSIGPSIGSCGTAAFYGEPVFVTDIRNDPLWVDFRDLAQAHGLRACWSLPVKDADGRVVATFANYYREPRHPRSVDYEAITLAANTVRDAIAFSRIDQPA